MTFKKIFTLLVSTCLLLFGGQAEAKKFLPPYPTAELDLMDFPQLYPTYSWLPVPRTEFYEVQVVKIDSPRDKIVRQLFNKEAFDRMTDPTPFTEAGEYYWQVRVVDKKHKPLSDWSQKKFFTVTTPVKFAILGDSISHGGASYVPAGQLSCQWETYCSVPVKNLAQSGDTTQVMLNRFDNDVLPFKPQVLLIMGGVNDIRMGSKSDDVIKNLEALRDKCLSNDITPVFCTLTSMVPEIMLPLGIHLTDGDWREAREQINNWIMRTPYFIDVAAPLTDAQGYMRAELTPDGLHPALRGKMIIGETIGEYLRKTFADKI
ncbi:MAG: hypothetical protein IKP64_14835 [Selenomonadaceae bacterium]|nr:hypothetical protein [Selenomonadaceae bacterium]MBR4384818.1 hypothetical protein [Selenomonadaceae bacterium]